MTSYYDLDPDDDHPPEPYRQPQRDPQPDDFCECRPGTQLRQRWLHDPTCLRWTPPLAGPGSTDEHRARVQAHCKALIADAQRRHQENTDAVGRAHRRQDHTSEEQR